MTQLEEQIQTLKDQLILLEDSNKNTEIIADYELIKGKLNKNFVAIEKQNNLLKNLSQLPEGHEINAFSENESEQLTAVKFSFDTFKSKWQELDDKVRQDESMDNAQISLAKLCKILTEKNNTAWSDWVTNLSMDFYVNDASLKSQESIPGLEDIVNNYKIQKSQFMQLSENISESVDTINILEVLSEKLQNIKKQMKLDLPEEVKRFFDAFSFIGSHQVSLSLITPTVVKWLQENHEIDKFVVKRKG